MSSGLYTAYLGLRAREEAIDLIANNLANSNTAGYKADSAFFQAYQTALEASGEATEQERLEKSVQLQAVKTDFTSGPIRRTDRELDVALEGEGFFVVQTAAGERYTRSGNFTLNGDGQLVTQQGDVVIGQGGPITITGGALSVDQNGNITADGQVVGTLRVVTFPSTAALRKQGNNLFALSDPKVAPLEPTGTRVLHGHLEGSNVNTLKEMTSMMKYMREFESLQRMLVTMTNDLSTSQMGRITQ